MKDNNNHDRRRILQGIGIGSISLIGGFAGSASASRGQEYSKSGDPHTEPDDEHTVKYADLTGRARKAFTTARTSGSIELGRPKNSPRQLLENHYVTENGQLFELLITGGWEARYAVDVQPAEQSSPDSSKVVKYEHLGEEAKKEFQKSRSAESTPCMRTNYPQELVYNQYVEYDGTTFATNPIHQDAAMNVLMVEMK